MTMAVVLKVSDAENANVNDQLLWRSPDIVAFQVTTFDYLLASDEVIAAFALQIGEYTRLLGETCEVFTLSSPGNTDPSAGRDGWGAVVVGVAEEPLRGAS